VSSTYRVADLGNEAAKNLMPWAVDALKSRMRSRWRTGTARRVKPDAGRRAFPIFMRRPGNVFHSDAQGSGDDFGRPGQQVRRVYLNVPHSKNPKPTWFGESVGHYEGGDTLVVDTIGLNDRTFVDATARRTRPSFTSWSASRSRTGGKTLDVSFTADDPGTFYKPWARGGRVIRWSHRMRKKSAN